MCRNSIYIQDYGYIVSFWFLFSYFGFDFKILCMIISPLKFFRFFFKKALNGWRKFANFGMDLLRWWTERRKVPNFLRISGGLRFNIALVFKSSSFIPFFVGLEPGHSIPSFANWHFGRHFLRFCPLDFWDSFWHVMCSSNVPQLTMSISSRKLYVFGSPMGAVLNAFWNPAGISVSP